MDGDSNDNVRQRIAARNPPDQDNYEMRASLMRSNTVEKTENTSQAVHSFQEAREVAHSFQGLDENRRKKPFTHRLHALSSGQTLHSFGGFHKSKRTRNGGSTAAHQAAKNKKASGGGVVPESIPEDGVAKRSLPPSRSSSIDSKKWSEQNQWQDAKDNGHLVKKGSKPFGLESETDELDFSSAGESSFWDGLDNDHGTDLDAALDAFVREIEDGSYLIASPVDCAPPNCACGKQCVFREVPSLDDYIWTCAELECMFFQKYFNRDSPVAGVQEQSVDFFNQSADVIATEPVHPVTYLSLEEFWEQIRATMVE